MKERIASVFVQVVSGRDSGKSGRGAGAEFARLQCDHRFEFNSHHRVVAFYLLRGPYFVFTT